MADDSTGRARARLAAWLLSPDRVDDAPTPIVNTTDPPHYNAWNALSSPLRVLSGMKPKGKAKPLGAFAMLVGALAARAGAVVPPPNRECAARRRDWTTIGRDLRWYDTEENFAAAYRATLAILAGADTPTTIAAWSAAAHATLLSPWVRREVGSGWGPTWRRRSSLPDDADVRASATPGDLVWVHTWGGFDWRDDLVERWDALGPQLERVAPDVMRTLLAYCAGRLATFHKIPNVEPQPPLGEWKRIGRLMRSSLWCVMGLLADELAEVIAARTPKTAASRAAARWGIDGGSA